MIEFIFTYTRAREARDFRIVLSISPIVQDAFEAG